LSNDSNRNGYEARLVRVVVEGRATGDEWWELRKGSIDLGVLQSKVWDVMAGVSADSGGGGVRRVMAGIIEDSRGGRDVFIVPIGELQLVEVRER
jgi:hypothetical protein